MAFYKGYYLMITGVDSATSSIPPRTCATVARTQHEIAGASFAHLARGLGARASSVLVVFSVSP